MLRTDRIDPAEPSERIEPAEPNDSSDPADPNDRIEPTEPTERIEPAPMTERIEKAESAECREHQLLGDLCGRVLTRSAVIGHPGFVVGDAEHAVAASGWAMDQAMVAAWRDRI